MLQRPTPHIRTFAAAFADYGLANGLGVGCPAEGHRTMPTTAVTLSWLPSSRARLTSTCRATMLTL